MRRHQHVHRLRRVPRGLRSPGFPRARRLPFSPRGVRRRFLRRLSRGACRHLRFPCRGGCRRAHRRRKIGRRGCTRILLRLRRHQHVHRLRRVPRGLGSPFRRPGRRGRRRRVAMPGHQPGAYLFRAERRAARDAKAAQLPVHVHRDRLHARARHRDPARGRPLHHAALGQHGGLSVHRRVQLQLGKAAAHLCKAAGGALRSLERDKRQFHHSASHPFCPARGRGPERAARRKRAPAPRAGRGRKSSLIISLFYCIIG